MSILKYASDIRDALIIPPLFATNYLWDSLESYLFKKINLITKEDTLWDVGVGTTGLSLFAAGPYVSDATGIDPALLYSKELGSSKKIGKYVFLKEKIENVIENSQKSGISPTLVISNDYSGMHNNIKDLINLGVEKFIISTCGCDDCVVKYHKKDNLKSNKLTKMFPDRTYFDVAEKIRIENNQVNMNSAFVDVVDMSEVCRESGYNILLFKKAERLGKKYNQNYLLIATKGQSSIESLYAEQTKLDTFVFDLFFRPNENPYDDD